MGIIDDPVPPVVVCVVENGVLRLVTARYDPVTGDTLVDGRRFSEANPAAAGYAAGASWFIDNEPVPWKGRRVVKYGPERTLGIEELTLAGEYEGVPVFGEAGAASEIIYLPVRPGCVFQTYLVNYNVGAVRG